MTIQRVTPQPLRCCGGIDRHTATCHLFAGVARPRPVLPPPARLPYPGQSEQPKESNRPALIAVLAMVAIVLIVAGVVWNDATATPATDATTSTPSAQAGVPVPQVCR